MMRRFDDPATRRPARFVARPRHRSRLGHDVDGHARAAEAVPRLYRAMERKGRGA